MREWIEYWTEIDLGYLGTDSAIEWPLGKTPVVTGIYCGNLHDAAGNRVKVGPVRQQKARILAGNLLAGKSVGEVKRKIAFSYSKNELQVFAGVFENIASLHSALKPHIIPLYRAMDGMPDDEQRRKVEKKLIPWIKRGARTILEKVTENLWVPYDSIIGHKNPRRRVTLITDASTEFGLGGYCWELKIAFQCSKSIYEQFLRGLEDGNPDPEHINVAEMLAPQLLCFLALKKQRDLQNLALWVIVDNSTARANISKGRARHPGLAVLAGFLARQTGYTPKSVDRVSTEVMQNLGGDLLSRVKLEKFRSLKVTQVNRKMFTEFWKEVFEDRSTFPQPPFTLSDTRIGKLLERIHDSMYHPVFAEANPRLWQMITILVCFTNSVSWLDEKARGKELAGKQFENWGVPEEERWKQIEEMIAPPPSDEALRLAYLMTERFFRYGQAPGTIQNYLRFGDIYPTPKDRKGWSNEDRWLGQAILKAMKKAYSNESQNVVPLTAAISFWLFLKLLKDFGNEEWTQLFWLASNVLRVGLFRSCELLYDDKDTSVLVTLADVEIQGFSLFE